MELHTQHYKDDFDLDKELIPKLAYRESRRTGTFSGYRGPAAPIPCGNGKST